MIDATMEATSLPAPKSASRCSLEASVNSLSRREQCKGLGLRGKNQRYVSERVWCPCVYVQARACWVCTRVLNMLALMLSHCTGQSRVRYASLIGTQPLSLLCVKFTVGCISFFVRR